MAGCGAVRAGESGVAAALCHRSQKSVAAAGFHALKMFAPGKKTAAAKINLGWTIEEE